MFKRKLYNVKKAFKKNDSSSASTSSAGTSSGSTSSGGTSSKTTSSGGTMTLKKKTKLKV